MKTVSPTTTLIRKRKKQQHQQPSYQRKPRLQMQAGGRVQLKKIRQKTEKTEIKNKESPATLEWLFINNATAKILDILSIYKELDNSESDIAKLSKVSFKTVIRDISRLEELGIVKMTRKIGMAKMYRLNLESKTTQHLENFINSLTDLLVDKELKRQEKEEEWDH